MARKSRPYRPEPVIVGNLRARLVRGPHADDSAVPENERRWYWRVWRGNEDLGTLGWLAPSDVARIVAERFTVTTDDTSAPRSLSGTVGALVDAYIAHIEARPDLAKNTKRTVKRNLGHVRDALGDLRVGAMTDDTLQTYQNTRLAVAAPQTVNIELNDLMTAWRWGSSGTRTHAARRTLKRPRLDVVGVRDKYTPPDDHIRQVRDAIRSPWARLAVSIMFETGMRVHEVASLTPGALDQEQLTLTVPRETKTGERAISIRRTLAVEITTFLGERSTGTLLGVTYETACAVDKRSAHYIASACTELGVPHFTPHGIRRAVVRRFRRAGVSVSVAAKYLGHSPTVMLTMYDEVTEGDQQDALALLDAFEARPKKSGKRKVAVTAVVVPEA